MRKGCRKRRVKEKTTTTTAAAGLQSGSVGSESRKKEESGGGEREVRHDQNREGNFWSPGMRAKTGVMIRIRLQTMHERTIRREMVLGEETTHEKLAHFSQYAAGMWTTNSVLSPENWMTTGWSS
jgi:IS5 family transposase